jgi:hypothetical protein
LLPTSRKYVLPSSCGSSDTSVSSGFVTYCDDDGEVGGMNGFGRGNRSTQRKHTPTPLCPNITLTALNRRNK